MSFVNDYDLTTACIGTIIGFDEKPGRTGFQMSMFIRGEERTMDITEEAYQIRWDPKYFPYPCLGEVVFMVKFDENGIINEVININDISKGTSPIKTGLVMGTCCMFRKPILEDTPTFSDIFKIEGDTVTMTNFDKYMENGEIGHCVYGGAMPEPKDGMSFKLAKDVNVYTWDWSTALIPFQRTTREAAEVNKFVTRFSLGDVSDIMKHCYWITFYSTRGNENEIDFIKCFLNKAPGWVK